MNEQWEYMKTERESIWFQFQITTIQISHLYLNPLLTFINFFRRSLRPIFFHRFLCSLSPLFLTLLWLSRNIYIYSSNSRFSFIHAFLFSGTLSNLTQITHTHTHTNLSLKTGLVKNEKNNLKKQMI